LRLSSTNGGSVGAAWYIQFVDLKSTGASNLHRICPTGTRISKPLKLAFGRILTSGYVCMWLCHVIVIYNRSSMLFMPQILNPSKVCTTTTENNDASTVLEHVCGANTRIALGDHAAASDGGADGFAFVIQRAPEETGAIGLGGAGLGQCSFIDRSTNVSLRYREQHSVTCVWLVACRLLGHW